MTIDKTILKERLAKFTELSAEKKQLMADLKEVNAELKDIQEPLVEYLVEEDQPGFAVDEQTKVMLKRKAPAKKTINRPHIEARLLQFLDDVEKTQSAVDFIYSNLEKPDATESFSLEYKITPQKKQRVESLE